MGQHHLPSMITASFFITPQDVMSAFALPHSLNGTEYSIFHREGRESPGGGVGVLHNALSEENNWALYAEDTTSLQNSLDLNPSTRYRTYTTATPPPSGSQWKFSTGHNQSY
jgi:outer membrane receptor for monomeric catechols